MRGRTRDMSRPLKQLVVLAVVGSVLLAVGGYVACLFTRDATTTFVLTLIGVALLAAGLAYFYRRALRAEGIDTSVDMSPQRWRAQFVFALFVLCMLTLNYTIYALTRNRPLEFIVAFVIGFPASIPALRKVIELVPLDRPYDVQALRLMVVMELALFVIFCGNLALQLTSRYMAAQPPYNWLIAGELAILPTLPLYAYFAWRRLRERGAPASDPTA